MSTTQTSHTPGPWHTNEGSHPSDQVFDAQGHIIADCKWTNHIHTIREANARLIAAAPELLEALHHALNDLESRQYMLPVDADETERAILEAQHNIYSRAIAKAEGGQP